MESINKIKLTLSCLKDAEDISIKESLCYQFRYFAGVFAVQMLLQWILWGSTALFSVVSMIGFRKLSHHRGRSNHPSGIYGRHSKFCKFIEIWKQIQFQTIVIPFAFMINQLMKYCEQLCSFTYKSGSQKEGSFIFYQQ